MYYFHKICCLQFLFKLFSGYDLHDKFDSVWQYKGKYSTDVFTQKAEEIIENHDRRNPLFLFVSHLASHTGENGTELGVPDVNLTNSKYSYIRNPRRRLYAGIVSATAFIFASVCFYY